jgi:hypothetical protein
MLTSNEFRSLIQRKHRACPAVFTDEAIPMKVEFAKWCQRMGLSHAAQVFVLFEYIEHLETHEMAQAFTNSRHTQLFGQFGQAVREVAALRRMDRLSLDD